MKNWLRRARPLFLEIDLIPSDPDLDRAVIGLEDFLVPEIQILEGFLIYKR